jgi:hypothetical protein
VETGRQLKNFAFVKEFSDVEFIVGSVVFPAHKVRTRTQLSGHPQAVD